MNMADDIRIGKVIGRGGGVRHTGYFSPDNPYFSQISDDASQSNQDKDALYARAVEWEASRYNLEEQREYDRQVLEEQREYDSPAARLARDKQAGINSELGGGSLSGSSSGGSSAQLAQRQIEVAPSDVSFSNAYANADKVFSGITTASNLVGSLASGFSSIVGSLATIKKLPSEISLTDAEANLKTAQATEIQELLNSKKEYQGLLNQAQRSENVINIANSLAGLLPFLTPDTDISPILSAMNISESDHSAYSSLIRDMQGSPQFQARHNASLVSQAKTAAEMMVHTQDYFTRIYDLSSQLEEDQLNLATLRTGMEKRVQNILANSGMPEEVGETQILGATSQKEAVAHSLDMLRQDVSAYSAYITNIANTYNNARSRVDFLSKKAKKNSREEIEYRYLTEFAIPSLNALGSQSVGDLNKMISEMRRNAYASKFDGSLQGQDEFLQNLSLYWGDVVFGAKTKNDIASQWVNSFITALGVGGLYYSGYKSGTKPQMTGQTILDSVPSADGSMVPTHQRTIQTLY